MDTINQERINNNHRGLGENSRSVDPSSQTETPKNKKEDKIIQQNRKDSFRGQRTISAAWVKDYGRLSDKEHIRILGIERKRVYKLIINEIEQCKELSNKLSAQYNASKRLGMDKELYEYIEKRDRIKAMINKLEEEERVARDIKADGYIKLRRHEIDRNTQIENVKRLNMISQQIKELERELSIAKMRVRAYHRKYHDKSIDYKRKVDEFWRPLNKKIDSVMKNIETWAKIHNTQTYISQQYWRDEMEEEKRIVKLSFDGMLIVLQAALTAGTGGLSILDTILLGGSEIQLSGTIFEETNFMEIPDD